MVALFVALCLPHVAAAQEKVRVGVSPAQSTAGIFIAQEKGYFKAEGLDVELIPFSASGPEMLPALASGQLDAGAGNISAKLYNAMARGIQMRIVADKGSNTPHSGYLGVVVRKALASRVKGPADLKGLKVALTGPGVSQEVIVDRYLRTAGLSIRDVQVVYLSYQDAEAGLITGAVDATVQIEPLLTEGLLHGDTVLLRRADQIYPYQQSAVIVYSEHFAGRRHAAGERFMTAYLRGVRDYRRAFVARKAPAAFVDEIVRIMGKWTPMRDPSLMRRAWPAGLNPDGFVNAATMLADLRYYQERGYVKTPPDLGRFIDQEFARAALRRLGAQGASR